MKPEIQQFYRPHELRPINPEILQQYLADYEGKRDELIEAAADDRDRAVSYRNFKVGSVLLSKDPNQAPGEYSIYSGHNYKPEPGHQEGVTKRCAEKQALEQALARHTEQIVAIISVSDQISTGDSSNAHDALHPCGDCRKMIRQMLTEGLINENGIICNVNDSRTGLDGKWVREERTVRELLNLYEKQEGEADDEEESIAA